MFAGIETFCFGAAPHPQLDGELCLEAAQMRDNILCLPVHDQITDGDVEKMGQDLAAAIVPPPVFAES